MAFDRNDRIATIPPDGPLTMPAAPRLCLRPSLPGGHGTLDGGWWPHSRGPAAELRKLLAGVNTHFGQLGVITRVALSLAAWDRNPALTLLVVPPEATAEQAAIALEMAALDDNSACPAAILTASGITTADPAAASRARHPSVSSVWPSTSPLGEAHVAPVPLL